MNVSWEDLVSAEPGLADLEARVKAIGLAEIKRCLTAPADFDANAIWFGYDGRHSYKKAMCQLVGLSRKGHPVLGTSTAYDIAYRRLYGIFATIEEMFALDDSRSGWGGFDG